MDATLTDIDAVFLDLDGTIYLGGELIEGAEDFLQRCRDQGLQRYFLSNNSSKSVTQYLSKLHALGLEASEEDVLLSTHDLLAWLNENNITKTWLVGTEGMRSMLEEQGIATASSNPEYVVLGYDTELTYAKIAQASIHMHAGVPLVASHPDMVCPSPDGGLPDVGAYLAMFKATTGVDPEHISGKPNPGMILHKIKALGLKPERCATPTWPWRVERALWGFSSFRVKPQGRTWRLFPRVLNSVQRSSLTAWMNSSGDRHEILHAIEMVEGAAAASSS